MKSFTGAAFATAAALYIRDAAASPASFCPDGSNSVCFQWGVPEASAQSGSGNVYFQISAVDSIQWIGLGIGTGMVGADMFLIYQDGSGNVTLSTRTASGHIMPQYVSRTDVELLAGSGVENGMMVANIKCGSTCGGLDYTGTNSWIAAWKQGDALDTDNVRATIQEHDDNDVFGVDFSKATVSTDSNPFLDSSSSGSNNSSSGNDSGSDSGSGSDSDGDSGSGNGAITNVDDGEDDNTLLHAHGLLMSLVFIVAYPIGALLMPLIGRWYIHAAWQILAFLGMWAGFGIGYHLAKMEGYWFNETHIQLGTIVVALMVVQPILGLIHHRQFRQYQRRGIFSHAHIWYGRILLLLGIINGGLGLELANAPNSYIIAYSVIAAVVGVVYVGNAAFTAGQRARVRSREKIASPQMTNEDSRGA